MAVKYWSFAGIMLTTWCNARCGCCYLSCSGDRSDWMTTEQALGVWQGLVQASPHGCRVHLTGGEAFGNWPGLIELCREARRQGLRELEKVETNAFWACSAGEIDDRLRQLDEAGMGRLAISCDPYHQQFVPIERCRLLAERAEAVLGNDRVQVRWRDWLKEGFDTDALSEDQRGELFSRYGLQGRERLGGRAARLLAGRLPRLPLESFTGKSCRDCLLRGRHIHIGPDGNVMPGTCSGIVLGNAFSESISSLWQRLKSDCASRPILGRLVEGGPAGLLDIASRGGFVPGSGYASKCHLCFELRSHLFQSGGFENELGPAWLYQAE